MFLILTQFSLAVLAGLGLDLSAKLIVDHKKNEEIKKLVWVGGGVLLIIFGLKLGSNKHEISHIWIFVKQWHASVP